MPVPVISGISEAFANDTSITLPMPTDAVINAGDLLIASVFAGDDLASGALPGGWTWHHDASFENNTWLVAGTRVADGSDADLVIPYSGSFHRAGQVLHITGADTANLVVVAPVGANAATATLGDGTAPAADTLDIGFAGARTNSNPTVTWDGGHAAGTVTYSDGAAMIAHGYRTAPAGATGATTATLSTSARNNGWRFLVPPAAAGSGGLVKTWNGSAWVQKPAKHWTGAAWASATVKHWTGSAWNATS